MGQNHFAFFETEDATTTCFETYESLKTGTTLSQRSCSQHAVSNMFKNKKAEHLSQDSIAMAHSRHSRNQGGLLLSRVRPMRVSCDYVQLGPREKKHYTFHSHLGCNGPHT